MTDGRDSLMELPLVKRAFTDSAITWAARTVDARWYYNNVLPSPLTGFNPAQGTVYYGSVSATKNWSRDPHASVRSLNDKDRLLREVLFGVHDYLHNFAYRAIQQRMPEREFGTGPVTASNFEEHVFMHLLTEAVATVGLDYWYLCTFDLEQRLRVGTNMRALTVSYSVGDDAEYRQWAPGFTTQEPGFLRRLCEFYCTGEFIGFDLHDVRRSPRLLRWLSHEVAYGDRQRRYSREWISHLSQDDTRVPARALAGPVVCTEPWQRMLMDQIGDDLWALVREDRTDYHGVAMLPAAESPIKVLPDFRFTNLATANLEEIAAEIDADRFPKQIARYAVDQFLASINYSSVPADVLGLVQAVRERADLSLAIKLMTRAERLPVLDAERRDIFLLQ